MLNYRSVYLFLCLFVFYLFLGRSSKWDLLDCGDNDWLGNLYLSKGCAGGNRSGGTMLVCVGSMWCTGYSWLVNRHKSRLLSLPKCAVLSYSYKTFPLSFLLST